MSHSAGTYAVTSTKRGLAPAVIRLATRSHWTHAFIALGDGVVVEAHPGGVRVVAEDRYDKADVAWADRQPLSDRQRRVIADTARRYLGTPYNWWAIVWFALASFGIRWSRFSWWVHSRRGVICSQLVVDCQRAAGVQMFPAVIDSEITPGMLGQLMAEREW